MNDNIKLPPLPLPDAYLFQHEETGLTEYVDSQQVEWGFEEVNPRWQKIHGAFTEQQLKAYATAAVEADRQANNLEPLTPAEAVFSFAGWLTGRSDPVTLSSRHGAAIAAELAAAFNESQGLHRFREDFHKHIKPYPAEKDHQRRRDTITEAWAVIDELADDESVMELSLASAIRAVSGQARITRSDLDLATELWAAAQTAPGEGIEDAENRIAQLLAGNRRARGEPVLYQARTRPVWDGATKYWTDWGNCTKDQANDYRRVKVLHDWEYEVRELYTAPQPQQIPEDFLRSVINLCGHHGASPFDVQCFDPEDKWIADLWRKAEAMLEAAPEPKEKS